MNMEQLIMKWDSEKKSIHAKEAIAKEIIECKYPGYAFSRYQNTRQLLAIAGSIVKKEKFGEMRQSVVKDTEGERVVKFRI